jgi:hypothetical protein
MKGKCFREPIFHKVVNGKVTQFRKIMKPQPYMFGENRVAYRWGNVKDGYSTNLPIPDCPQHCLLYRDSNFEKPLYPRYKPGETVYLKEPYIDTERDRVENMIRSYLGRKPQESRVRGATQMPERLAKHFIEIAGVKAERLQDISDEDCLKEGIKAEGYYMDIDYYNPIPVIIKGMEFLEPFDTPREAYAAFIDAIHGKGTWESNPWTWVYNFKLTR